MASDKNIFPRGSVLGTVIGTALGMAAWHWWKTTKEPAQVKEDVQVDTGQETQAGNPIVDVTGIGGTDDGKAVQGYVLPSDVKDIKFPLKVIVKPNKSLFLRFKVGEEVIFNRKRGDGLIWTTPEELGEYIEWYPNLKTKVLGAI